MFADTFNAQTTSRTAKRTFNMSRFLLRLPSSSVLIYKKLVAETRIQAMMKMADTHRATTVTLFSKRSRLLFLPEPAEGVCNVKNQQDSEQSSPYSTNS